MRASHLLFLAALATPIAVVAQEAATPETKGAFAPGYVPGGVFALKPEERFKAADKNNDGKVTKDEFLAVLPGDAKPFIEDIFTDRDTNKDGWLTAEEMNANTPSRRGARGR